jgi:hypothetical protein
MVRARGVAALGEAVRLVGHDDNRRGRQAGQCFVNDRYVDVLAFKK